MNSIAEYYSLNLAQEVMKGMTEKVKNGGTLSRAPVGYLNVRSVETGREVRHVVVDPDRAEDVRWAFEQYGTGQDWTLARLASALETRGLTIRATAQQAERPLTRNRVHSMLRNRYYLGIVTWKGVEYAGTHGPLITHEQFDKVQARLESNRGGRNTERVHMHYLAGSLFCHNCSSRLLYMVVKGRGGTYEYFACSGRHTKQTPCQVPYMQVDRIEGAIDALWKQEQVRWDQLEIPRIRRSLIDHLQLADAAASQEAKQLQRRIDKIKRDRYKWADRAMEGVVPDDIAKEKQDQLARQLASLEQQERDITRAGSNLEETLNGTLNIVGTAASVYRDAADPMRRAYNQAWWSRIIIRVEMDEVAADGDRAEIFESLGQSIHQITGDTEVDARAEPGNQTPRRTNPGGEHVMGSIKNTLVEHRRIRRRSSLAAPPRIARPL